MLSSFLANWTSRMSELSYQACLRAVSDVWENIFSGKLEMFEFLLVTLGIVSRQLVWKTDLHWLYKRLQTYEWNCKFPLSFLFFFFFSFIRNSDRSVGGLFFGLQITCTEPSVILHSFPFHPCQDSTCISVLDRP